MTKKKLMEKKQLKSSLKFFFETLNSEAMLALCAPCLQLK